jgi:serine/threonine protein kinase
MRIANYEYSEQIGKGAFGTIYKGHNIRTGEQVVIKTEPMDVEFSTLKHESSILNILYSKACRNIPPTYWYGIIDTQPSRALVMPFYKESLETFSVDNDRISSNIMRSAISILNHIHDKYVVHRDIKPANFMIHNDELVLIDFGLASFYVDSEERHIHKSNTKKRHIIGTPKYASFHVHEGEEYSRRDDLMSMVYVGLFLRYGSKLWSDMPKFETQLEKSDILHPINQWFKLHKPLQNILELTKDWSQLHFFAEQVYKLSFQERPSYKEYIELFAKTI